MKVFPTSIIIPCLAMRLTVLAGEDLERLNPMWWAVAHRKIILDRFGVNGVLPPEMPFFPHASKARAETGFVRCAAHCGRDNRVSRRSRELAKAWRSRSL